MRVVVLGSGVVGVTSAYYLARAGHEVTVIDREAGPALETSFANAGQISPGYASPWAAPGVPLKAVKWMFQKHAPLAIRLDGTQFQLQWMWQMLQNCTSSRYAVNKGRMVRLAEYSRDCLQALRAETGIQYEGRTGGTLQVFRTQQQFDGAAKDIAVLQEANVSYELLSPAELAQAEPALAAVSHKLTGGLRLPGDETATARCSPRASPRWPSNWASSFATTHRSTHSPWRASASLACNAVMNWCARIRSSWRWGRTQPNSCPGS